jgi:hypothetical protein
MRTVKFEIETGNAAFRLDDETLDIQSLETTIVKAISRISWADLDGDSTLEIPILDLNGNRVGSLVVEESDEIGSAQAIQPES